MKGLAARLGLSSCFGQDSSPIESKSCEVILLNKEKVEQLSRRNLLARKQSRRTFPNSNKAETSLPRQAFLKLAKQQKFTEIGRILENDSIWDVEAWLEEATDTPKTGHAVNALPKTAKSYKYTNVWNGESALHLIVNHRPPVSLVDSLSRWITKNNPGYVPEDAVDARGQTPLHIAVIQGCDVTVIDRLANSPSSTFPTTTMDDWRRCPLHWACCMKPRTPSDTVCNGHATLGFLSSSSSNAQPSQAFVDNMVKIVLVLIKSYPQAAVIEDKDRKTPLDLAVDNKLDRRILLSLLKASNEAALSSDTRGQKKNRNSPTNTDASTSSLSSLCSTSTEECFSVPMDIVGRESVDSDTSEMSSIGDGGASVYKPSNRIYEGAEFYLL
jgi:hypothetical protein